MRAQVDVSSVWAAASASNSLRSAAVRRILRMLVRLSLLRFLGRFMPT